MAPCAFAQGAGGASAGVLDAQLKSQGGLVPRAQEDYAGEFSSWNIQVPRSNYNFVRRLLMVFGNKWGPEPQKEEEYNDCAWQQLVLSYEAFRRGIEADKAAIGEEVTKMLAAEKVTFDWKKDAKAYAEWVNKHTGESVEIFENQLSHMIQLEKLRKQVLDSFKPTVNEQEAIQKFRDEYNTLELQLVQFDELDKAKEYYKKMRNFELWDAEAKKNPKFCQKPGFVSLEFLIAMWKIPKDDCYKMMKLPVNSIYPPTPVYKGYAVMRVLKQRPADDKEFPKLRDSYFKQVEMNKRYEEIQKWVKKLKQDAGIIEYPRKDAAPVAPAPSGTAVKESNG